MANELTNAGEEYVVENNTNMSLIQISEPTGGSYARQSSTVTTLQIGSDFGFDNDSQLSFDVSDSSQTVDHAAFIVNFQSDTVAGDGSANDNLIGYAALSQSRDLSQIDTLNIPAGDLELTLT